MNTEAARDIAAQSGWLSCQPIDFVDGLLRKAVTKSYAKGEYITHLGVDPNMMFGIVEGTVLVGLPHPIIDLCHWHLGRPGDWLGEAAALRRPSTRLSTEALDAVHITCVHMDAVDEMIQEHPSWALSLLALLVWNQEAVVRTALDLLLRDPTARVSARLLTLCGATPECVFPTGSVEVPLTQTQLATMCGLSRKCVHRVLSGLEARKICEALYGKIVIVNPLAPQQMAIAIGSRVA